MDKRESSRAKASHRIKSMSSPRKRKQMESLLTVDIEMPSSQPQEDEGQTILQENNVDESEYHRDSFP